MPVFLHLPSIRLFFVFWKKEIIKAYRSRIESIKEEGMGHKTLIDNKLYAYNSFAYVFFFNLIKAAAQIVVLIDYVSVNIMRHSTECICHWAFSESRYFFAVDRGPLSLPLSLLTSRYG